MAAVAPEIIPVDEDETTMSRIGRAPIELPDKVQAAVDGSSVSVKGPKGELFMEAPSEVRVELEDGTVTVHRSSDHPRERALHGLTRSLIANMVEGVTQGFRKELEIVGVGYRAEKRGTGILLHVGYSHPVQYDAPEGITLDVPAPTQVVVEGIDKQLVGHTAAEIRKIRTPEPYKGKGIRYKDEQVRRKAGKTAGA